MAILEKTIFFITGLSLGVSGSLWSISAEAEGWQHFGSPPSGFVFVETSSETPATPVQLAGTLDPARLYMNGKEIRFAKLAAGDINKPGFWIDEEKQEISSEAGRFFRELSPDEMTVPYKTIRLRNKNGQIHEAKIKLNRTFLESAFSTRLLLAKNGSDSKKYPITIRGLIPKGSSLNVKEGNVKSEKNGLTQVTIKLPAGKSVMIAKLVQDDGSERVINVPLKVNVLAHLPGEPYLSLKIPENVKPSKTWVVASEEIALVGRTNVHSAVKLQGKPLKVSGNGNFTTFFQPRFVSTALKFEVTSASGKKIDFKKSLHCPECTEKISWYYPPFHAEEKYYLTGSFFAGYSVGPGFGLATKNGIMANLGLGYHFSNQFTTELRVFAVPNEEGRIGDEVSYTLKNIFGFSLPVLYHPFRFVFIGAGPGYVQMDSESLLLSTPIKDAHKDFYLQGVLGLRIGISENFEYTPRFNFSAFQPNQLKLLVEVLEFLAIRYYY